MTNKKNKDKFTYDFVILIYVRTILHLRMKKTI